MDHDLSVLVKSCHEPQVPSKKRPYALISNTVAELSEGGLSQKEYGQVDGR